MESLAQQVPASCTKHCVLARFRGWSRAEKRRARLLLVLTVERLDLVVRLARAVPDSVQDFSAEFIPWP